MRLRDLLKKLEELSTGGYPVPDANSLHSIDPAELAAYPDWDSNTGWFINASGVDMRELGAHYSPPLESDKGYFLELTWGTDSSDDTVSITMYDISGSSGSINVQEFVGPVPANNTVFGSVYMPPGFAIYIENRGPSARFGVPNVYDTL